MAAYGPYALVTWFVIFGVTLAGFGVAISLGFKPEGVAGNTGTWLAAYAATQVTKPIRIVMTLALTPLIAKVFRREPQPAVVTERSAVNEASSSEA